MTVATRVDASVVMLSCHNPDSTISARHTAETIAARTLPMTSAITTTTAENSHHGESASTACNGSMSTSVNTSLIPLVTGDNVVCTHVVTSPAATPMALPMLRF